MSKKSSQKSGLSQKTILGGVAVVVLIAAAVAFFASGDDSSSTPTTSAGPTTTVEGQVSPAEYQFVAKEGLSLIELADGSDDPAIGATAPTLKGYSFDGKPLFIQPGSGKPMMVVFLAHWCPHCNREVPRLVQWNNSGMVPADLQVVGVATASNSQGVNWPPSQWIQDVKWPWSVMADDTVGTAARAYGVSGFPFFALIDAKGKVVYRGSGEKEISEIDNLVRTSLGLA